MADIVFSDAGLLWAVVLDATVEERHSARSTVSRHPVERGVDVSDHVRPEPRELALDVAVSDSVFRAAADLGGSVQRLDVYREGVAVQRSPTLLGSKVSRGAVDTPGLTPWTVQTFFADRDPPLRVLDTWTRLIYARDNALLASITTPLETYQDMVLSEIQTTRRAADSTWLRASLVFTPLLLVALDLVDDPVPARARDRRQVNRGAQSVTPVTPAATPRLESGLSRLSALWGG
jgi:hypothetical protein